MNGKLNATSTDVETIAECPGCGGENLTILEVQSDHKIFLTDADELTVTTGVCGCESCGLTFLNPRMGQKKLFEYYTKQSRIPRSHIEAASPFAAHMDLQIDLIEKVYSIKGGGRALEIGCAEGFFLQALEKRAQGKMHLYGVELSEKYVEQARKQLPEVVIFETPLEKTNFKELKFDLIIMRHVLEHLSRPMECLQKIREILAPGGALYIEVPDSNKIAPSVSRFYHHEHLLYFTPQVLNNYLTSAGLQPVVCERFVDNPAGSGFSYPVIRAVGAGSVPKPLRTLPGHARSVYLENMAMKDFYLSSLLAPVLLRLQNNMANNSSVGIFGAGPHTMDLLELLEDEEVVWSKIFDNNPNKQGKTMRGIPIVKPDLNTLQSVDCVLISSAEFEDEMVVQVRTLVGTQVEIIRIYGNDAAQ